VHWESSLRRGLAAQTGVIQASAEQFQFVPQFAHGAVVEVFSGMRRTMRCRKERPAVLLGPCRGDSPAHRHEC